MIIIKMNICNATVYIKKTSMAQLCIQYSIQGQSIYDKGSVISENSFFFSFCIFLLVIMECVVRWCVFKIWFVKDSFARKEPLHLGNTNVMFASLKYMLKCACYCKLIAVTSWTSLYILHITEVIEFLFLSFRLYFLGAIE